MPELDDIVQRISLSGQDEVIASFLEIGKQGAKAFEELNEKIGLIGGGAATAVTGITALGASLFLASKHAADTVIELRNLANQTGESIESISSLKAGLASMGADTEHLGSAFARMGLAIERSWEQIKRESGDARDKQIADMLSVQKAEQSQFDEREKARAKLDELGVSTSNLGYVSDYQKRQNEIAKVRTAMAESDLKVREAQRKADEDRLNSLAAVTAAVEKVVKGESTVADVSKEANLSTENIIKGITAISTPGATDVIKNMTGDFRQLTGMSPEIKQAFYNVADFLHNAKDAATEASLEFRIFGRSVGQDMIVPLKEGSAAIQAAEQRMRSFGLVITDEALEPAENFHKTFNELSYALSTTIAQLGLKVAPAFTEAMRVITDAIEQNHDAIIAWGDDLANALKHIEDLTKAGQAWLNWLNQAGPAANKWLREHGVPLPEAGKVAPEKPEEAAAQPKPSEIPKEGIGTAGLKEATDKHVTATAGNTAALDRNTAAHNKASGQQEKQHTATAGWVKATDALANHLKPGGAPLESAIPGGAKWVNAPLSPREPTFAAFPPGTFSATGTPASASPFHDLKASDISQPVVDAIKELGEKIVSHITSIRPESTPGGEVSGSLGESGGQVIDQAGSEVKDLGTNAQSASEELNQLGSALTSFLSSIRTGAEPGSAAGAGTEGFASGGLVGGYGGIDSNLIRATRGEYVVTADGSNLGAAIAHFTRGFVEGGLVGGFVDSIRVPGYAAGGLVVNTGSAALGGRPIELHIGGEKIVGLTANESAASAISRIAVERAVRSGYSGGGKSSWYRGS